MRRLLLLYTGAYNEQEIRGLAAARGVSHILLKPAKPEVILQAVQATLGLSPASLAALPLAELDYEHLRLVSDKLAQKVVELAAVGRRLATLTAIGQELIVATIASA